jgi:DDE superfamily endonuclease
VCCLVRRSWAVRFTVGEVWCAIPASKRATHAMHSAPHPLRRRTSCSGLVGAHTPARGGTAPCWRSARYRSMSANAARCSRQADQATSLAGNGKRRRIAILTASTPDRSPIPTPPLDGSRGEDAPSGRCHTLPHAWQPIGSVIEIPTATHSRRLNVLGFLNRQNDLYPHVIEGKVDTSAIVECFEQFSKHVKKKNLCLS